MKELLAETADRAARYVKGIGGRRVAPLAKDVARLQALGGPLPQMPSDPAEVLALLDDIGSPATVATTGGRYFGFVIGGSLPAALAANWLAGAWDQNASMYVMSPFTVKIEQIVMAWMDARGPRHSLPAPQRSQDSASHQYRKETRLYRATERQGNECTLAEGSGVRVRLWYFPWWRYDFNRKRRSCGTPRRQCPILVP